MSNEAGLGGMKTQQPNTKPAKEQKHVGIFKAVNRLETEVEILNDLITRVESGSPPTDEGDKKDLPMPTLSYFLDNEAERITVLWDRLSSQINKLRELLY